MMTRLVGIEGPDSSNLFSRDDYGIASQYCHKVTQRWDRDCHCLTLIIIMQENHTYDGAHLSGGTYAPDHMAR